MEGKDQDQQLMKDKDNNDDKDKKLKRECRGGVLTWSKPMLSRERCLATSCCFAHECGQLASIQSRCVSLSHSPI